MRNDVLVPWYEVPYENKIFTAVSICHFVFSNKEIAILFGYRKLAKFYKKTDGSMYAICPYCNQILDLQSVSTEVCPHCNKKFYRCL